MAICKICKTEFKARYTQVACTPECRKELNRRIKNGTIDPEFDNVALCNKFLLAPVVMT